ncbi:hypothetical protein [Streptomyces olivochromogenes]|uniref:hypothetical protein n=1 Tax=Streptomyces olivochromogenes TaxID=1963 RepID=UPI001F2CEF24|nr:hypothetical protein [Streptomyces olivochromogenes]MCF3132630.1 hypothetical protein [Streptomyces olivochromogenes]
MKRSSGVHLCATAAVSVLSLALITGCSDGGSKGSGDAKDGKGSGSSSAAKARSAAELDKLILAQGEAAGYKVAPVDKAAPAKNAITADKEQCKPLLYVMSGNAPADAAAETNRTVSENKKDPTDKATSMDDLADGKFEDTLKASMDLDVSIVSLSSYDGDGAEKALTSVSDAVKACAGGFTGGSGSDKEKFTKVTEEKSSGTGDASVAFATTGDMDGDTAPVHAEVVRHGNTLAAYYTMNIGAMMAHKDYAVPAAVIKAQAAKLK